MNKIRLWAFVILFTSFTYINWYGDKIGHDSARYGADKFPSGWGFYCVPAAFLLGGLSVIVLAVDALVVLVKWIMGRRLRAPKKN